MRICSAFLLLAALLSAAAAFGDEPDRAVLLDATTSADPATAAQAFYRLAELDDRRFEFALALQEYDACISRAPSGPFASRAAIRASTLRGHAEGDFAPLVRLEHVRRDPSLANDPSAVAALVHDADSFPPGRVRVEARMLAAEAYLGRLRRTEDAIPLLRLVAGDPHADVVIARQAGQELVDALIGLGRLDDARLTAETLGTRLDPKALKTVHRMIRRRLAHRLALVDLALVLVLALGSLARTARQGGLGNVGRELSRFAPLALAFAAFAGVSGGLLASSYEAGNAAPFVWLAATTFLLMLLGRAWGAAGSVRASARAARALLCASGVVAAAFLMLETGFPSYLEGYGL